MSQHTSVQELIANTPMTTNGSCPVCNRGVGGRYLGWHYGHLYQCMQCGRDFYDVVPPVYGSLTNE
jgi:hypothetical protein